MDPRAKREREKISALAKQIYAGLERKGQKLPVIERGTPEWDAWRKYRADRGIPNSYFDSADRYTVPTQWPPDDIDGMLQGGGRMKERLKS